MAGLETCAVQRINIHKKEVFNLSDGLPLHVYRTIEFDSYDDLRSCAASEGEARAGLEKLLAGYCSAEVAVLDCRYTRDGSVKIEKREKAVPFTEKLANAWRDFWARHKKSQEDRGPIFIFAP